RKAMSCIYRTGQRFGAMHVIAVLRGEDSERIRQLGHDRLSTFGIGADLDERAWRGVLRQLVAQDLVEVDAEGYGSLRLTASSRDVLTGGRKVSMRKEAPRARRSKRAGREGAAQA